MQGLDVSGCLTIAELSEMAKLSQWTLRRHCRDGRIKARKIGNRQYRVPVKSAAHFLGTSVSEIEKQVKQLRT